MRLLPSPPGSRRSSRIGSFRKESAGDLGGGRVVAGLDGLPVRDLAVEVAGVVVQLAAAGLEHLALRDQHLELERCRGGAVREQLEVAAHLRQRHSGGAQAGERPEPGDIDSGVAPVTARALAANGIEQPGALVVAQGVLAEAAQLGSLADGVLAEGGGHAGGAGGGRWTGRWRKGAGLTHG